MLTWTQTADGAQRAVIAQGADDATPLLTLIITPSLGSWEALVRLGRGGDTLWWTRVATEGEAKGTAARLAQRTLGRGLAALGDDPEPIHDYFELSRAQYLAIPRSVLQSMPAGWQAQFTALLRLLDETIDWRPQDGLQYEVRMHRGGQYVADPLQDYERGRRRIPHRDEVRS